MADNALDVALLRRVRRLVAAAGRLEPRSESPDLQQLERFAVLPARFRSRPAWRAVIALPTRGCRWFRPDGGACTHCGLIRDGLWDRSLEWGTALESFRAQLARAIERRCTVICLYVAGSFFDDEELSPETRTEILRELAMCGPVEQLVVECRPELVRRDAVRAARDQLGSIELVIGLGFDSFDRRVRALCLNKLTTERTYRQALDSVLTAGAQALTYVVLKPPFLDEGTAVREAIETGRFAFAAGASAVSVEPLAVQEGTLANLLWSRNLHHPPRLWSLVEVLQALQPLGTVLAGGSVVYPRSVREPCNCERCTRAVLAAIEQLNLTQTGAALAGLTCDCLADWRRLLERPERPLEIQVESAVIELERMLGLPALV